MSDPTEAGDPAYVAGLKTAVSAALSYGLAGIEEGDTRPGPIPAELVTQARHAARSGATLETVLRRYIAGYTLLADLSMQEAQASCGYEAEDLQALSKTQATLVDRVIVAISSEYQDEAQHKAPSPRQR